MKSDESIISPEVAMEELNKYNKLYAEKEQELNDINNRRLESLEELLRMKDNEIYQLKKSLERVSEEQKENYAELFNTRKDYSNTQQMLKEVNGIIVKKDKEILSLQKIVDEDVKKIIERAKIEERSLLDKCSLLREENKTLKWNYDTMLR